LALGLARDGPVAVEQLAASLEVLRPDGTRRPVGETPPLRALQGETVTNQVEIIRTPASGELRYRQVSAAPVRDQAGQIIGSVSVVRDITELQRAEAALHESNADLQWFNQAAVGRELRMIELKQEVNALLARRGEPAKY